MSITITLAQTVSAAGYAEVESLAQELYAHDSNFKDRAMKVQRGSATVVTDSQDALRAALLQLMVEGVLSRSSD